MRNCSDATRVHAVMATSPPHINVYASLPRTVAPDGNLSLHPNNWQWVHCLTLPLETLNTQQFSSRPYKWIQYAIGVVVGAEGTLCASPHSSSVVDYNTDLPTESINLYYHTADEERHRVFPVHPTIVRTKVTSSVHTFQRDHFHEEVAVRDSRKCVLTGLNEAFCEATHLIPHSKGNSVCYSYIQFSSLTIAITLVHFNIHSASQSRSHWR
jgi:hypothetical protein